MHQQVAADAGCGIVERFGRQMQIARPDQPDNPLPKVRQPQQHERDEDNQHHSSPDRLQQRRHHVFERFKGGSRRLNHLDASDARSLRLGRTDALDLLGKLFDGLGRL